MTRNSIAVLPVLLFSSAWLDAEAQFLGHVNTGNRVGAAVASGDFDGDGYADLAASAPGEYIGFIPHGGVHVVYGSANGLANGRQQWWNFETLGATEAEKTAEMGETLESGDFNGDGYDDLALSGNGVSPFGPRGGAVYVVYGSETGLNRVSGSQVWHMDRDDLCFDTGARRGCADGSAINEDFGYALAAGDFNNDSFDELAIGIPGMMIKRGTTDLTAAGVVLVLQGSGKGLVAEDHRFWSQDEPEAIADMADTGNWFGSALEAGDINGDGFDELAIGSFLDDAKEPFAKWSGTVNLLFGSSNGLSEFANMLLTADPPGQSDNFGTSLAIGYFGSGPTAQPRYAGLAVGIPGRDEAGPNSLTDEGAVAYYEGSDVGPVPANIPLIDGGLDGIGGFYQPSDWFGTVVQSGDFDGDGFDELVVGVPGDGARARGGAFHVLPGSSNGLQTVGSTYWTTNSLDIYPPELCIGDQCVGRPGTEVEALGAAFAAGDFNMDGYQDLAVGAPGRDRYIPPDTLGGPFPEVPNLHIPRAGAVHVMYGSEAGLTIEGAQQWFQNLPASQAELITPANDSEILIGGIDSPGNAATPLALVWGMAEDPDSNTVSYRWQISSSEAFDDTLASVDAGESNQLIITHGELGAIMTANGVAYEETVMWYHRVVAHDGVEGTPGPANSITMTRGMFVATADAEIPKEAAILSVYPNPAHSTASIRYRTSRSDRVVVSLHDVRGAELRSVLSEAASPGERTLNVDVGDLPNGVYLYSVVGGGLNASGKIVVVR